MLNKMKDNVNVDNTCNRDTVPMENEESEDDEPSLSEASLQALREHFSERMTDPWTNNTVKLSSDDILKGNEIPENWVRIFIVFKIYKLNTQ